MKDDLVALAEHPCEVFLRAGHSAVDPSCKTRLQAFFFDVRALNADQLQTPPASNTPNARGGRVFGGADSPFRAFWLG